MENTNNHFSKYPHGNEEINKLTVTEGLVYVSLRYFYRGNSDVYPSLQRVADLSELSIKTVDKCIKKLIDKEYITREKKGKKYFYTFLETDEQFEKFSDAFLLNRKLSAREKAYIISITRFMFKNSDEGTGDISYTNREIAEKINVSERMVIELNKSLVEKEILQDSKAVTKKFNLRPIDQMIILELANQKEDIEDLKIKYNKIEQDNEELRKELSELKKTLDSKNKNTEENKKLEDFILD